MKLIKNGSEVIGLLFANDTVKGREVSADYLSSLGVDDDADLSVADYIASTLESNSQYDNFGDIRVTEGSEEATNDLLRLMELSKKDLVERMDLLNKDIINYYENGVDAEDFDRVTAVFEGLRNIYRALYFAKKG